MPLILRRRLAWVLLCALVLAVLAPGVARAMAAARGTFAPWSVLCAAPGETPPPATARLLEHCAWCGQQADRLAPPPTAVPVLPHPALRHAAPAARLPAPGPQPPWTAALARAPPPRG